MREIIFFDLIQQPNERIQKNKQPDGRTLLLIDIQFGLSKTILVSQVMVLVESEGRHMLQSVIIIFFKCFKAVKESLEQKLHPGFEG